MIAISLLLFYGFGFSQVAQGSTDMDYVLQIVERLKEKGEFENWPCKNGPIRTGIIHSKDYSGSLQEAEAACPFRERKKRMNSEKNSKKTILSTITRQDQQKANRHFHWAISFIAFHFFIMAFLSPAYLQAAYTIHQGSDKECLCQGDCGK